MKSNETAFKDTKRNNRCDVDKLKQYFYNHFNKTADLNDPLDELLKIPWIYSNSSKCKCWYKSCHTRHPRNRKSSTNSRKRKSFDWRTIRVLQIRSWLRRIALDLHKFYTEFWETKNILSPWKHSKLVALWKGAAKEKASDPKSLPWTASRIDTL